MDQLTQMTIQRDILLDFIAEQYSSKDIADPTIKKLLEQWEKEEIK